METVIAGIGAGLPLPEVAAEYSASALYSAACYEQVEHIRVLSMIVSERKLREVQREIFLRDVVETAHNPALEQCPERFNVVGCGRCHGHTRLVRG
jgi:hypothetical protein